MFDIQDLDDLICQKLRQRDLAQCVRVNKKWHRIVIPYLWRDFRIDQHSYYAMKAAIRKMVAEDYFHKLWEELVKQREQSAGKNGTRPSSPFSSTLSKHGHLIQKAPEPRELLSWFSEPLHITKKKLRGMLGPIPSPTPRDLLHHFYKNCHNPTQILYMRLSYEDFARLIWQTITPVATRLHIRHICVGRHSCTHYTSINSRFLKYVLDQLSTALELLTLEVDVEYIEDVGKETERKVWTSLKELRIQSGTGTVDTSLFWPWLWTRCRHVETLKLALIDEPIVKSLADAMSTHMPNVNTIELDLNWSKYQESADSLLAALLSGSRKGWKVVKMYRTPFGEMALKAMTGHFSTLKALSLHVGSGVTGDHLVQVLSSCPNLCSLIAAISIKAETFVDRDPITGTLKEWSCEPSLKHIRFKIGDIPRPDLKPDYTVIDEVYLGQGQAIQKLVYERLGRLVNLETLMLAHDFVKMDGLQGQSVQSDCLEVSLESGLDKLSGLKALRTLSVPHLGNTRNGDVQWMAENWPTLGTIYGLFGKDIDDLTATEWWKAYHSRIRILKGHSY
ncbi:hypothetical protein B0O80DRAFT_528389 [Mortierella sp. GBAus27b]|nr:hypothetical protein BGX31_011029 [Mortierella sp. GBA43]KAI8355995.1 hypothetical protein B0O80DRAFT_528389 [Mortierella sp. GBAus27b]